MSESLTKPQTPPLSYLGGKWKLAPWICSMLPDTDAYIEPFFGGGNIFFTKGRSKRNYLNDKDAELVNFFRVLRERKEELMEAIVLTPHSREEFEIACTMRPSDSDFERARKLHTRTRYSLRHTTTATAGAFLSYKEPRMSLGKRLHLSDSLIRVAEMLDCTILENMDWYDFLNLYQDTPNALIYCDPPYLPEVRTSSKEYGHEMTREDHERLLSVLLKAPCKVAISSYDNELYNSRLAVWTKKTKSTRTYATVGKDTVKKTECLWTNFESHKTLFG